MGAWDTWPDLNRALETKAPPPPVKKLAVVGLGLGFHLSWYLASKGHEVHGVDVREEAFVNRTVDPRLDNAWKGQGTPPPVHLSPAFSTDFANVAGCSFIFIFVSTPFDREAERLSIRNVLDAIASASAVNPDATYLVLSTLPVGGMARIRERFPTLRMFYCPPMVKKADFLSTFVNPPSGWQLIGTDDTDHFPLDVLELYLSLLDDGVERLVRPDCVVEAAKLCTNLLLSTKVILANAIAEWLGDPEVAREVCAIVEKDPRVGKGYMTPGGPAAGPCFPRDLIELESASGGADLAEILAVLNRVNRTRELVES